MVTKAPCPSEDRQLSLEANTNFVIYIAVLFGLKRMTLEGVHAGVGVVTL